MKRNAINDAVSVPDYERLSARFKLLAHPERLRILDALRRDAECVCHLEALLGKPQPYVSQQLRILREAHLIVDEKDGLNVYYRLADKEMTAWLDVALGSVDSDGTQQAGRRSVVGCPCPKCAAAVGVSVDELVRSGT